MKNICIVTLILLSALSMFAQNTTIKYHGIVNENSVRVRETMGLTGNIVGKLNRGDSVFVLGRSQERMYLDGYDSYWLKIATDAFEGWSYGAYINILDADYETLPVAAKGKTSSDIDLNYSRQLPTDIFLIKEREMLKQQSKQFISKTLKQCYDNIVIAFKQQQSLRPFFLNTLDCHIVESDWNYLLSSSLLCEYIQSSYYDDLKISKLYIKNDNSAVFWIDGFKKKAFFEKIRIETIVFNILKVEDSDSHFLEGKILVDDMYFSPLTLKDFNNSIELYEDFFSSASPYFCGASFLLQMLAETMEIDDDALWVSKEKNKN